MCDIAAPMGDVQEGDLHRDGGSGMLPVTIMTIMMMMMQNWSYFSLYNFVLPITSHVFCICSVLPEDGQVGRNVL